MIYDAVHQAVLLYRDHRPQLLELAEPLELPPPSEREQQFQALWKQFYKTLEIQARHNERGRMTHCPKRFWARSDGAAGGTVKQRGTSCIVPNAVIKIRTGRYHAASPGFCILKIFFKILLGKRNAPFSREQVFSVNFSFVLLGRVLRDHLRQVFLHL